MNPIDIIAEFYKPGSKIYSIMIQHGEQVAQKALDVADKVQHLNPDKDLIQEAAMLHDIGIFKTDATYLGCHGTHPYVVHGYLGRVILEKKGLKNHALVCERHVGVGLTADDIKTRKIPLPVYDMVPVSIEEKIVCYADKFYSKSPDSLGKEKSVDDIINIIGPYGQDMVAKFTAWHDLFEHG